MVKKRCKTVKKGKPARWNELVLYKVPFLECLQYPWYDSRARGQIILLI